MSEHQGIIAGGSARERAVMLAGCLAELGQTKLLMRAHGADVELTARVTNLPAFIMEEIERTGMATITAPALCATFNVSQSTGTWTCADAGAAALIAQRLHR
jgi:poly(A) polymerase Pap1